MSEVPSANGNGNGNGHGEVDPLKKRVEEGPRGGARTWYEVLEVQPDVSPADLKKAYDRALALVEGRNIGGYLMLDPLAAESARADVEAAYSVLGNEERRRAYDEKLRASPISEKLAPSPSSPAPREKSEKSENKHDEEARQARELLAIEAQQQGAAGSSATVSSPGLRFTAPAEPSEELRASPSKPSPAPTTPSETSGKFRISVIEPVEDVFTNTPHFAKPGAEDGASAPPSPASDAAVSILAGRDTIPVAPTVEPAALTSSVPAPAPAKGALPETGEVPGSLVRELREARGLTLDDLADATKIRKPYLRAIEEEDVPNLPARVYLRGFLTQIGRVLKVDRVRLAEGYLQTVERLARGAPTS